MKRSFEGSVYKSKDRKGWIARLRYTDQEGVQREKKRICLTHAIAQAKIKQLRTEIEAESSDRKTFRQLDEFFRTNYLHEARFVNGKKLSGFRQPINILTRYLDFASEHFGDRYLDEITYSDLREYKKRIVELPTIHGSQRSVADTNQFLRRLRRLFTIAVQQGWLLANPFSRGESLISDSFEVERTRILSPVEEARLLAACSTFRRHLVPVIVFAIETACRKNEILSLNWSSVNMQGRFIKIESSNTKTLRSRLVPISDRLVGVLETLWTNSIRKNNSLVFTTGDFKKAFNGACSDAGIHDLNFHDLRHTGITRMLEAGISPPLVMKISGHTQQKTFLRYVNQSESSIFDIAKRLGKAA